MEIQSPTINALAEALLTAQGALKPALKDSTNPHFKSKYADLQSVWEAARPALQKSGLSVTQTFANTNGEVVTVVTTLLHKSGEWIRSELTLKPSKPDPQGIGSAITYGRRYGLSAILGIVADEDDDGNAASRRDSDQVQGHRVEPLATANSIKALNAYRTTEAGERLVQRVLKSRGARDVDDLYEDDAQAAIKWVREELAKKP
jgi:hypothetical protein